MKPYLENCGVFRSPKFGGVALRKPLKEFNEMGFNYGDSVDIIFSNGEKVLDVPYYDNYYVPIDMPVLCGFPTFSEARLAYNMTRDAWYFHHLDESCTACVSVREAGKYLMIQSSLNMNASDKRADYPDDATFANFREVRIGHMKSGMLYRSASPCDLEHNRNSYADELMEKAGVNFLLSLADSADELCEFSKDPQVRSPHFKKLYGKGLVWPVNIAVNYRTDAYKQALGEGLRQMCMHEGPYLVYCSLGKDRTGFVVTLLAALCGASYNELATEYMITYKNFYQIDIEDGPERYFCALEILFSDMIKLLTGIEIQPDNEESTSRITEGALIAGAERYLAECGLSPDETDRLRRIFSD